MTGRPGQPRHQRDVLLATVAHELRNEIAPLGNALEVLSRSNDASARTLAAAVARRQLNAMSHLVEDLTDFGQASLGSPALQRRPVDLGDLVGQAVQACRPLFQEGRQLVHLDRSDAQPLTVNGDPMRLWQVLVNLLNNAAKFTQPAGHVWVSAGRAGRAAQVCVADDGVGIAPEDLKRIFRMFQQGGGGRHLSPRGLGVGLAVVRRFVELHGGTVHAASPGVDRGATFTVRLPLAEPA